MPGGRLRRGIVVAALISGLGLVNWVAATDVIDISASRRSGTHPQSAAAAESPAAIASKIDLGDLGETLARPLFSDSRRPFQVQANAGVQVPAEAPAPTAPSPKLNLKLLGTMNVDAEARKALMQTDDAPRAVWVGVGEAIGGWRLVKIANGTVEIETTGARQQLTLYPTPAAGAAR